MIELTDLSGQRVAVAENAVLTAQEASPSSAWHGIRSIVHLTDGRVIEVREPLNTIIAALSPEGASHD